MIAEYANLKNSNKTDFARSLRQKQTDAKILLWAKLREIRLSGIKFRRQHSIGEYVVDFICIQSNLIVEVDGSQHSGERNQVYDSKRTVWLEQQGFRVLRFWDNDVLNNIEGVTGQIFEVINSL